MEPNVIYQTQDECNNSCHGIRRFVLVRERDLTGVSGTGIVAEGAVFSNGLSVLHWLREPQAVGMYQTITDLIAIHGHEGATNIQFFDQE